MGQTIAFCRLPCWQCHQGRRQKTIVCPTPVYVLGQIATLIQDVDPLLHKWAGLQVPRDREAEARDLPEPLLQPAEINGLPDSLHS